MLVHRTNTCRVWNTLGCLQDSSDAWMYARPRWLEVSLLYFADFLPDFFSQNNSLCLEDFLCYSKIITNVQQGIFFFFSGLKLTNLGEILSARLINVKINQKSGSVPPNLFTIQSNQKIIRFWCGLTDSSKKGKKISKISTK